MSPPGYTHDIASKVWNTLLLKFFFLIINTFLSSLFPRIRSLFITGITAIILPFSPYQRCINMVGLVAAKLTSADGTGNSQTAQSCPVIFLYRFLPAFDMHLKHLPKAIRCSVRVCIFLPVPAFSQICQDQPIHPKYIQKYPSVLTEFSNSASLCRFQRCSDAFAISQAFWQDLFE